MALNLGTLMTRFGADTDQLDAAVQRSEGKLRSYSRRGRAAVNTMGKIGVAAAAAGAAIGAKLVSKQLDAIDSTAKLARQLGTTTESIIGLQHAAELTGPGAEKLAGGLEAMTKRIGEAEQGTGRAKDALEQLGIPIKDIIDLSPDDQFRMIAGAMQNVEGASRRNALAAQLFSRANQELVNTLMLGQDGLARMEAEAAALGATFSRVEAAQVEAANDAMTRVGQAVAGVSRQLTIKLAPIIEGISNQLVGAAKEAGGMGAVLDSVISGAVRVVGVFADGLHGLRLAFAGLKVIAAGFGAAFWTVIEELTRGIVNFGATINSIVNSALRAFNAIPGVGDIPLLSEDINPPFLQRLESIGGLARENLGEAKSAMQDLAMQPLPSTQIEQWVAKVQQGARDAAEAAEGARARIGGGADVPDATEEPEGADDKTKEKRARMQAELDMLRKNLATEREVENMHYEKQLERLRMFKENELITEQEFRALKEEATKLHEQRLTEIQREEQAKRDRFQQKSWDQQVGIVAGNLQQMTRAVGTENKKMFKLTQAAAIANAIVNAHQGISKTLAAYPYPLSIAFAAAQGVAAFAQVNAIKSQSFNGSSGEGGGGGGGAAASSRGTAATGGGGGGGEEVRRVANVNITGDNFGGEGISRLAEELGDFLGDGGRLGTVNVNRS